MRKREQFFLIFLLFLFLSIMVFLVAKAEWFGGARLVLESGLKPLNQAVFSILRLPDYFFDKEKQELKKTIIELQKKIVDQKNMQQEIQALKDQFQITSPGSQQILPAKVIGMPRFIPGISAPNVFIIGKGEKDGIRRGQAVVVRDTVVGKVTKTSKAVSVVTLVTDSSSTFAGMTTSGVLGVVKGREGDIVFDNILSSQKVSNDEIVVTKGDINEEGIGYPPNLVVGNIVSIDKTQSNLFQTAQVKSPIDFSRVSTVFVVISNE